jgi:putative PIN family toxin of toxin-antitoxin system
MKLAVIDTNVLISAGVNPGGPPAILITEWVFTGQVHAVTSPVSLAEYREVTLRPKFRRYGFPSLWLESFIKSSLQLPDPTNFSHTCRGPNDTPFLAPAHTSGAWLITGNSKHFSESIRNGVTVIAPAGYLAHLAVQ